MQNIKKIINDIISKELDKNYDIGVEDKIEDYLDSIDFLKLIIYVEKKLDIKFPIEKLDYREFCTMGDFIKYIQNIK